MHGEHRLETHPFQTRRSPQEVEQHRFGMIVGVMSEQDMVAAVLPGTLGEELVPGSPGRHLERDLFALRPALHLGPRDFEGKIVLLGQVPHKGGIVSREEAAQLVVQVAENQLPGSCLEEGVQERHRIPSARDAQQIAAAGSETRIEREHGGSVNAPRPVLNVQPPGGPGYGGKTAWSGGVCGAPVPPRARSKAGWSPAVQIRILCRD